MNLKSIAAKYYKTIAWSIIMCYMLFSPSEGIPKVKWLTFPNADKLIHFGMFGILTFLFLHERFRKTKIIFQIVMIFFLVVGSASALSEIIQYFFIPGRTGNIYDLFSDLAGLFWGFFVYLLLTRFYRLKEKLV